VLVQQVVYGIGDGPAHVIEVAIHAIGRGGQRLGNVGCGFVVDGFIAAQRFEMRYLFVGASRT
jgi:hypothetical protein